MENTTSADQIKNPHEVQFRILKEVRAEWIQFALLILFDLIDSFLTVCYSVGLKNLIDVASAGSVSRLTRPILYFCILILSESASYSIIRIIQDSLELKTRIRMRRDLLNVIETRTYISVSAIHSGIMMDRLFNDVEIVSSAVVEIIPNTFSLSARLLFAFIVIFHYDPIIPLVLIGAGGILIIAARCLRRPIKTAAHNMRSRGADTFSFFEEMFENLLIVKGFHAEEKVNQRAQILEKKHFKSWKTWFNLQLLADTGSNLFFQVGYLSAIILSAYGIQRGSMTFGTAAAIMLLVSQIQGPIAGLSGVLPRYYSGLVSMERIMDIEALPEEKHFPICDREGIYREMQFIEGSHISFTYDQKPVLDDISFEIKKGSFTLISGESGVGKSSLIKLLLGVYDLKSGKLVIKTQKDEIPVNSGTRKLFAYVPQGNHLMSGTIRDSLLFLNAEKTDQEIWKMLEISCAEEFVRTLPEGLDTPLGESGAGLSDGQVQRLATARALLSEAPILLLDEVTSDLDDETGHHLLANLKNLQTKTIILVSHKEDSVSFCDSEFHIENGKLSERLHNKC